MPYGSRSRLLGVFALCTAACASDPRAEGDPTSGGESSGTDGQITGLTTVVTTSVTTGDEGDTLGTTMPADGSSTTTAEESGSDTAVADSSTGGSSSDGGSSSTTGEVGVTIYDIQQESIPLGSVVEVTGVVVTGVATSGLFVEEPEGGPYSGIFVFTNNPPASNVGDVVDVAGTTAEQQGLTEIIVGMVGSVNPTGISGMDLAPDVPDLADFGSDATAEPWESVLVRIEGAPLAVEALPGFSEFDVGADGITVRVDNFLYDALADAVAFPGLGLEGSFTAITGPLNYNFDTFKIAPRGAADLEGYVGPPPPPWTVVEALGPGDLVITEIMYDPTCNQDDCEWIEVLNATAEDVNLEGLRIQDSLFAAEGTIDVDVIVPPGGYAVLATDDATTWPYANPPDAFWGAGPAYNNSGSDFAVIRNTTTVIDQTAGYTAQGGDDGHSWKLDPAALDGLSNDLAANWCYSSVVFESPGGTDEFGSPGAVNEAACATL